MIALSSDFVIIAYQLVTCCSSVVSWMLILVIHIYVTCRSLSCVPPSQDVEPGIQHIVPNSPTDISGWIPVCAVDARCSIGSL